MIIVINKKDTSEENNMSSLLLRNSFTSPWLSDFDHLFFGWDLPEKGVQKHSSYSRYIATKQKDDTGEYLSVELMVPGFAKEDLVLSIASNRDIIVKNKTKEKRSLSFRIPLGDHYDLTTIKAECKDGILKITVRENGVKEIMIE